MKDIIITPTYINHFHFIEKYLASAEKYILDPENITICFIINYDENLDFSRIIAPFTNKLDIKVFFFEEILSQNKIDSKPNELLEHYGKFSFQTLKKLYAILTIPGERFLILDSESMWIRPTRMNELFDSYFSNPFICGSNLSKRKLTHPALMQINRNIDCIFSSESKYWFLENFIWFYDKNILIDLIKYYGTPIEIIQKSKENNVDDIYKLGVFEIILYHRFIYENKDTYKYKFIDIDAVLQQTLSPNLLNKFLDMFYADCNGGNGVLEMALRYLDNNNIDLLENLFVNNRFNIIRCDMGYNKYWHQRRFIKNVKPNILAASQDHLFGVNNNIKLICTQLSVVYKDIIYTFLSRIMKRIIKLFPSLLIRSIIRILDICENTLHKINLFLNNNSK